VVVVGVPAVLVGYIYATELGLRLAPAVWRDRIRPWFWLAPALLLLAVFLILPTIGTIVRSFQNTAATAFVGLDNYVWFFGSNDALIALRNSALWVVFLTVFCVGLGLLIAVLVDRVRFESVAKSVIFVPLAISMVAAGVIWRFMYAYEAPGTPQTGFLNGVLAAFGIDPVPWLTIDTLAFNTILLIVVMTWMWTGFAMVILSAALKGISPELLEAARVDGASTMRTFWSVVIPIARPAMAVLGMLTFLTAWNDFFWPIIALTTDNPTVQVALAGLGTGYVPQRSIIMAGTLLGTLPVLVVFVVLGKQIVGGIMQGAVKG